MLANILVGLFFTSLFQFSGFQMIAGQTYTTMIALGITLMVLQTCLCRQKSKVKVDYVNIETENLYIRNKYVSDQILGQLSKTVFMSFRPMLIRRGKLLPQQVMLKQWHTMLEAPITEAIRLIKRQQRGSSNHGHGMLYSQLLALVLLRAGLKTA